MKKRFLEELKRLLAPLDENERREIIEFYEERFQTGIMYEGKTEAEIIDELERPEDIARNVLREYGYRMTAQSHDETSDVKSVKPWSVLWVVLFDVFVVVWFIPMMFSLLIGIASGLFGFIVSFSFTLTPTISTLFNIMFIIGIGFLWLIFLLWIYDIFLSFIIWLVRWHCDTFVIPNGKKLVRFLTRFKASSFIKRHTMLHTFKTQFKAIAATLAIVGVFGMLFTQGTLGLSANPELEHYDTTHTPLEMSSWTLETSMDLGNVRIEYHDGDEIIIEMSVYDHLETDLRIDEDERIIYAENSTNIRGLFTIDWFRNIFSDPNETVIYIPNDLTIETVDIITKNGNLTLNDFEFDALNFKTTNGTITLENISVTEMIDIETSNGRITLREVESPNLRAVTSNGQIRVYDSESEDIYLQTSNGNVTIQNINVLNKNGQSFYARTSNGSIAVEELYYKNVELRTSNGNIHYNNTDLTFILDSLITQTTNGSVDKNVPSQ